MYRESYLRREDVQTAATDLVSHGSSRSNNMSKMKILSQFGNTFTLRGCSPIAQLNLTYTIYCFPKRGSTGGGAAFHVEIRFYNFTKIAYDFFGYSSRKAVPSQLERALTIHEHDKCVEISNTSISKDPCSMDGMSSEKYHGSMSLQKRRPKISFHEQ